MPTQGLDETTQADWSGGMCRAVARHLIPGDAAYDIQDGLLDDDGDVYQRGPTARLTGNQLGTALQALWEAQFSAGRRTLGISPTAVGVIDAAGTSWVSISGSTGALSGAGLAAQLGESLLFPMTNGGAASIMVYGGSRKTAGYATGTISVAAGGTVVTGVGTRWLANADAGMIFAPVGVEWGVVRSVDSDTQITLVDPWAGPAYAAGSSYFLTTIRGLVSGTAVTVCGGRVLYSIGRKVRLSNTINQDTGASRPWTFDADDYHEFPADVVALATLRDTVFVFTKAGIWTISNSALPIVDAFGNGQHRVQKLSGDVVLRSPGGVASWRDSLVVGAVDGVYAMDSGGGLELISRSITPLWQDHMRQGHLVGQIATFRDHVFVPVYSTFGVGNAVDEVLVGRLDRRSSSPVGKSAPWTRFSPAFQAAEAGWARAFAVADPYGTPQLLAGISTHGYLTDYTGIFRAGLPTATAGSRDANGLAVALVVETREYVLDAGAAATVRDVAVEYESTDGLIKVSVAAGTRLSPTAAPDYRALPSLAAGNYATQSPRVLAVGREARRISFRLDGYGGTGQGVSGWRLRAVRLRTRLRGRRR